MAKPTHNNAEYFSHDADMRNDAKIKAIRRKYSHEGYAVWCFLLESLTDAEFFEIKYEPMDRELMSADFDVDVTRLEEIVDYCCMLGLLQKSEDGTRLSCDKLKERFAPLIEQRNRKREISEKRREAGKQGMQSRWGKTITKDDYVITNSDFVINEDNKTENSITKADFSITNSKVKESIEKNSIVSNNSKSTIELENSSNNTHISENENFAADKSATCVQNQTAEYQFVDVESTPTDKPPEKEKSSAKKEKEERHKLGNYQNVLLTYEEANSLRKEYGEDTISIVDNYSEYKEMKGYKCKRDYIAIKRWGAKAYYEQLDKNQKKSRYGDTRNNPTSPDYVSTERIVEAGIAMARANN